MALTTTQLSETFAALGDPTRLAIVARLAEGDATVKELAEPFAVSLPAISRHLKVLEGAGLIVRSREAQWRRARAEPAPGRSARRRGGVGAVAQADMGGADGSARRAPAPARGPA